VNEQYSYGWFVPFFAAFLFWLRFEDRPKADREVTGQTSEVTREGTEVGDHISVRNSQFAIRNQKRGLIAFSMALPALLLLLPLRVFEIGNPDWRPLGWIHAVAVVTLTLIYIWYVGGRPWLRHFAFPVAFFLVAVPWVGPIEEPIIQGLMRIVAAVATETLTLFGIPAHLEGSLIRVNNGLVGVNEACSGVRSLQTSLMIGLLFGELRRLSVSRRLALIAAAVAIALLANFARAFVLVWIAATKSLSEANRWHDVAGYTIVGFVFVGTMAAAALLARYQRTEDRGRRTDGNNAQRPTPNAERPTAEGGETSQTSDKAEDPPTPGYGAVGSDQSNSAIPTSQLSSTSQLRSTSQPFPFSFHLPASIFAGALAWLLLVEFAAHGWYRAHERNLITRSGWTVQWPKTSPGYQEIKMPEGVRSTLRYDDGQEVAWQANDPNSPQFVSTVYAFYFRWDPGSSSVVRARAHRPDICLPSVGWHQVTDRGVRNYSTQDGTSLPIHHITFNQTARHAVAHTFFCLQEDKLHENEPRPDLAVTGGAQPDWGLIGRTEVVKNGVRNLGQQVLEVVILTGPAMTDEIAEEKFGYIVREIVRRR
jgi:exosortase